MKTYSFFNRINEQEEENDLEKSEVALNALVSTFIALLAKDTSYFLPSFVVILVVNEIIKRITREFNEQGNNNQTSNHEHVQ